uniref:Uncharacterized protein n=1 Tax=Timema cristinae TaxID=61476 RepID=A0A7R9CZL8_TIMCR|nr:unnamed protein product [Timema cristinae]
MWCSNLTPLATVNRVFLLLVIAMAECNTCGPGLITPGGVWPLDLEVRKRAAGYWFGEGKLDKVIELTTNGVSTKDDIRENLLREWQADWEESTTGYGPYRASLFRKNLSETNLCCCGGETTPEHVTLECIFTEKERAELLIMPILFNAIYHILRYVDPWSYLSEIANRVSKTERDIHGQTKRKKTKTEQIGRNN